MMEPLGIAAAFDERERCSLRLRLPQQRSRLADERPHLCNHLAPLVEVLPRDLDRMVHVTDAAQQNLVQLHELRRQAFLLPLSHGRLPSSPGRLSVAGAAPAALGAMMARSPSRRKSRQDAMSRDVA